MALPTVIFEDEVLLAFDKPSGQLVAPDRRDRTGEDLMALVHAKFGPGIANVHRLDAETSGVLLCAKTKPALDFLSLQPANVSYQVYSGTNVSETNPQEVLAVCPIHNNVLLCDGSVQGWSKARWQAMQKAERGP